MTEDIYEQCTQKVGPCVYTIIPRDDLIIRFRDCCGKTEVLFRKSVGLVNVWDKQWAKVLEPEGKSCCKCLTDKEGEKLRIELIDAMLCATKQLVGQLR